MRGRHSQRRQNFTPRPGCNYSLPGQQNFNYRGMQQQRTSGSRRNIDQRLNNASYICFTIQHLGIMRANIYLFVLTQTHKLDNFYPAVNVLGKNKLTAAAA